MSMRIIAGNNRGTVLKAPKGLATRPTLGRVRESMFSILGPYFNDQIAVDLFAGAGSLGFEALSRYATKCYFVEKSKAALDCLHENASKLRYDPHTAVVVARDVLAFCKQPLTHKIDLVMLDPPYNVGLADQTMQALALCTWLADNAVVVCQCGGREPVLANYGTLVCTRTELYGETAVHFYTADHTP